MYLDYDCRYTVYTVLNGPHREKTCLWGFRQSEVQTSLLSYRDYLEIEISPEASLCMILSKNRITKALIRLCGCAGWSAPVLFANHRRQVFSRRGPNLQLQLSAQVHCVNCINMFYCVNCIVVFKLDYHCKCTVQTILISLQLEPSAQVYSINSIRICLQTKQSVQVNCLNRTNLSSTLT